MELDFDKEFNEFVSSGDGSAIKDIYEIIPSISQEQMQIVHTLEYYIEKWNLSELKKFLGEYKKTSSKNKNLGFLSSMNMKSLLKAYTQDELIRGIKISSQKSQEGD